MVIVIFKDNRKKLVNAFARMFSSVDEAKHYMEKDAYAYAYVHGGIPKWVNPAVEDYLEVEGGNGHVCIWQYFELT